MSTNQLTDKRTPKPRPLGVLLHSAAAGKLRLSIPALLQIAFIVEESLFPEFLKPRDNPDKTWQASVVSRWIEQLPRKFSVEETKIVGTAIEQFIFRSTQSGSQSYAVKVLVVLKDFLSKGAFTLEHGEGDQSVTSDKGR